MTRSLTIITDAPGDLGAPVTAYARIYTQTTGGPERYAGMLAEFLDDVTVVNGKGPDFDPETMVDGTGQLAAQLTRDLIDTLVEPSVDAKIDPEVAYTYWVNVHLGPPGAPCPITVTVQESNTSLTRFWTPVFKGTVEAFCEFVGSWTTHDAGS